MQDVKTGGDVLFILLGAVMVLAMHAGFAFLELGTVRTKNQVNALVKILVDFATSTIAYFFIGFSVAYGTSFLVGAEELAAKSGYEVTRFFFLLTFAAAIPAPWRTRSAAPARSRPASSRPTSASPACARCSISGTRSATPSRPEPATAIGCMARPWPPAW